jgi:hypothetical protein
VQGHGARVSGRGSIVSGWHFLPLSAKRREERDALLRTILASARALVENSLVRCTDFAFEQRVKLRRPVPERPGIYREQEWHTLAPDAAWEGAHPEGEYRLELCVQVTQEERGARAVAAQGTTEGALAALVEIPKRRRRRRRSRSILTREELARVFASFRRAEVREERDVVGAFVQPAE